jgi:AcrR family transcriptional regulator
MGVAVDSRQLGRSSVRPVGEGRSERKRRAILDAATTVFLRNGYLATTVDEIATLAEVSKPTIYKHFTDKKHLFVEIVVSVVDEVSDAVHGAVSNLADTDNVELDLRKLARRQLAMVMQPRIMQLRRLVIGEATRFPDLGRTFHERGPGRTITAVAAAFETLAGRGLLRVDNPTQAATDFNWLVMGAAVNRVMFLGDDEIPSPADLNRQADDAVRAFLAAYGGCADP